MSFSTKDKEEITKYINALRLRHKAPPLKWTDAISTVSQTWADQLISTNAFQHSKNRAYGENLFCCIGLSANDKVALAKRAIDAWYDEVKLYDFAKAEFKSGTGHFTCLVWKAAKDCGLGMATDAKTKKTIIVYNCSPVANMMGRFKENVLPM